MKKIVVTGGAGYIGSHTVVELQKKGYEVFILDNLSNSRIEIIERIEKITMIKPLFKNIDIADVRELSHFFEYIYQPDAIIHFAAYKSVGESVENPLKYYQNNLNGIINILQMMKKYSLKNIVFSSSCSVYGNTSQLPVTENAPVVAAESPYGNTKKICEEILYDVTKVENINCISLRYFNPVGADKSGLIGEWSFGKPDNLIPVITETAAGLREKVILFGNDYNTPDGTCIRDYIHVTDVAHAHISAIERQLENKQNGKYEVFNLGTGKGTSVMECINTFEKISGEKLKYEIGKRREGDVVAIYSDCKKSNEILGWKTELSLSEALRSAWEWQKKITN